jgi:hypothetical protein
MHTEQTVRRDLHGELLQVSDESGVHYAKRLSLEVAWHTNVPEDLAYWLDTLVTRVEEDWPKRLLHIHYNPFLKPLSAGQLQAMLRPEEPLAEWRLAQVAADLCHWLERCHAADLPQLVVHPGRIGLLDGQFVLLPTLSGILPPLSGLLSGTVPAWLPFVAPEVLRTRAADPALLLKGDVYALGRTLQVLVAPQRLDSLPAPAYEAAEHLVESMDWNRSFEWLAGPEMAEVVDTMCMALPSERPAASDLVSTFHALVRKLDPTRTVQSLIDERKLADAEAHLEALEASQDDGIFAFPRAKLHTLRAKAAMAHTPPQFARAIDQLKKAEGFEPKNPAIFQQSGRIYRYYTTHPQHLMLAGHAYERAAKLAGWRADLIEEWVEVLQQGTPERLLDRTREIPWDKRPAAVFALRASSLLETGNAHGAWHECVDYFSQFGFNQAVYETAQLAAAGIPASELLLWMRSRQKIDTMPAVQAIVYERNGEPEKAAIYLAHALRMASEET